MSVKVVVEIEKSLLDACADEGNCQWCRTPTNRFVSSQSGANYFCARYKVRHVAARLRAFDKPKKPARAS